MRPADFFNWVSSLHNQDIMNILRSIQLLSIRDMRQLSEILSAGLSLIETEESDNLVIHNNHIGYAQPSLKEVPK